LLDFLSIVACEKEPTTDLLHTSMPLLLLLLALLALLLSLLPLHTTCRRCISSCVSCCVCPWLFLLLLSIMLGRRWRRRRNDGRLESMEAVRVDIPSPQPTWALR
jgi:hypothetical protein